MPRDGAPMLREIPRSARSPAAKITTMELVWIPISMLAGLMQAVRTAAQKALNRAAVRPG